MVKYVNNPLVHNTPAAMQMGVSVMVQNVLVFASAVGLWAVRNYVGADDADGYGAW